MAQTKQIFEPAHFVGVRLHRANETARLQFAKAICDPLTVSIPARQLGNVVAAIERKLAKAPD